MKKVKLQPATHERTCQVCAKVYTYPEKGSESTRHLCELCAGLPPHSVQVFKRLSQRIRSLERSVSKLPNQQSSSQPKQEASP